ncbi:response regulator transcription factor [Paenibacillus chungangensis]|uniref:Response regulator n=1 Tax=Paenibacillus chungangensis TaxID=696535 RepID=A0ABW3HRR7_9BACL
MKMMIVDDEPIILKGIASMVRSGMDDQLEIMEAADGPEALERLPFFKPDLLMADVNMPEMSGLQLIEEAQRRGYCSKFIILTGYDEFEYACTALRLGVKDYLLKPVQRDELLGAIIEASGYEEEEEGRSNSSESDAGEDSGVIDIVLRYLRQHYQRDLSLDEVARHAGVHPNYLCHILKRDLGIGFVAYLRQIRIERAKELLAAGYAVSIGDIAQAVGYEQPRHFFKVFKKMTGMTPGQYRSANDQDGR